MGGGLSAADVQIQDVSNGGSGGSISGIVWEDANGNGENDGEQGVSGDAVQLIDPISGQILQSTVTDTSGSYSFTSLEDGSYLVKIVTTESFTFQGLDSVFDQWAGTASETVMNGQSVTGVNAGLYTPANIGGTAWIDVNGNGTQDNGEVGLPGVGVTLTNINGDIIGPFTTGNADYYSVGGLPPGEYMLQFTAPSGFVLDGTSTAISTGVSLSSGDTITQDVPVFTSSGGGTISGTAFVDQNENFADDAGDQVLPGVTVALLNQDGNQATDKDGHLVPTTTTDSSGHYSFGNLAAGAYQVQFTAPANYFMEATGAESWTAAASTPGLKAILNAAVVNQLPHTISIDAAPFSDYFTQTNNLPAAKQKEIYDSDQKAFGVDFTNAAVRQTWMAQNGIARSTAVTEGNKKFVQAGWMNNVRFSISNFGKLPAQDQRNGYFVQGVSFRRQVKDTNGNALFTSGFDFVEGFAADANGKSVILDTHRTTGLAAGQTLQIKNKDGTTSDVTVGSVVVTVSFTVGFGVYDNMGLSGQSYAELSKKALDTTKVTWLGAIPEKYTLTFTLNADGSWTYANPKANVNMKGNLNGVSK